MQPIDIASIPLFREWANPISMAREYLGLFCNPQPDELQRKSAGCPWGDSGRFRQFTRGLPFP